MILNTGAMFMQIGAMIKRNQQQIQKMFLERASTASETAATAATNANTAATNANTAAKAANAAATGGMAKGIGKSVLAMTGLGLAALVAGELFERLGFFASKATDEIEEMESVMVSATDVLGVMNDTLFSPENSRQVVADQQAIIDSLDAQRDASGNLTTTLQAEFDAAVRLQKLHQSALDTDEKRVNAAHAVSVATEENIDQFFKLKDLLDTPVLTGRAAQFSGSAIGGGASRNFTTQERADAAAQLLGFNDRDDAQAQFDSLTVLFGDSLDEIQKAYDDADGSAAGALESLTTYHGVFNDDAEVINALSTQVQTAADVLDNFNNSREEMFHGFRADNLTGDLVRQVQQQGVETLITTTEVVMTNVFNGVTIPEMADIIIEEIEFRGRTNGFNVRSNAA